MALTQLDQTDSSCKQLGVAQMRSLALPTLSLTFFSARSPARNKKGRERVGNTRIQARGGSYTLVLIFARMGSTQINTNISSIRKIPTIQSLLMLQLSFPPPPPPPYLNSSPVLLPPPYKVIRQYNWCDSCNNLYTNHSYFSFAAFSILIINTECKHRYKLDFLNLSCKQSILLNCKECLLKQVNPVHTM